MHREKRTEALKFQNPREADSWREKLGGQAPSLPPPQNLNSLEHYLLPVNLHSELCFLKAHCVDLSGPPQQPSHQGVSWGTFPGHPGASFLAQLVACVERVGQSCFMCKEPEKASGGEGTGHLAAFCFSSARDTALLGFKPIGSSLVPHTLLLINLLCLP